MEIVSDERQVEAILDALGDEHARELLRLLREKPRSARELADECGLSLPTVYRRLGVLTEHGLVREKTLVADDGNHYRVYVCNFDSTVISLADDAFDVRIYRTSVSNEFDDPPDGSERRS